MVSSNLLFNTGLHGRLYELPEDSSCVFLALQFQHLTQGRHQEEFTELRKRLSGYK